MLNLSRSIARRPDNMCRLQLSVLAVGDIDPDDVFLDVFFGVHGISIQPGNGNAKGDNDFHVLILCELGTTLGINRGRLLLVLMLTAIAIQRELLVVL